MIKNGQKIKIRYKILTEDDIEAASNLTDETPQEVFLGRGQLMPDLEEAIKTMEINETKKIVLPPEQAFGMPKNEFIKTTRLQKIPEKQREIGNILDMEDPEGNICSARIHAIEGNNVILDFNHPLAGQTVIFYITLVGIDD